MKKQCKTCTFTSQDAGAKSLAITTYGHQACWYQSLEPSSLPLQSKSSYIYLSQIVKVILSVNPSIGFPFVDTICLVDNICCVWAITVVQLPFEKLWNQSTKPHAWNSQGINVLNVAVINNQSTEFYLYT